MKKTNGLVNLVLAGLLAVAPGCAQNKQRTEPTPDSTMELAEDIRGNFFTYMPKQEDKFIEYLDSLVQEGRIKSYKFDDWLTEDKEILEMKRSRGEISEEDYESEIKSLSKYDDGIDRKIFSIITNDGFYIMIVDIYMEACREISRHEQRNIPKNIRKLRRELKDE